jgi:hypothetical protein
MKATRGVSALISAVLVTAGAGFTLAAGPSPGIAPEIAREAGKPGLSWTVSDVQWKDEIAFQAVQYRPDQSFLVIRCRVSNEGPTVAAIRPPTLVDAAGNRYEASWKGWVLPFSLQGHQIMVPRAVRTYVIVFDVPRNSGYRLRTEGGQEIMVGEIEAGDPQV